MFAKLQYQDSAGVWHWLSRDMVKGQPQPASHPKDAQGNNTDNTALPAYLLARFGLVTRYASYDDKGQIVKVFG
jgi:hypothetical protein